MRTCGVQSGILCLAVFGLTLSMQLESASAQPIGSPATTESFCNLGMVKDQQSQTCEVPIPNSCSAANFPGSDKKWTNISKGGQTSCQFDEKLSDWNKKIVGSCSVCKTKECSARFSVMFQCADSGTSTYKPQTRSK